MQRVKFTLVIEIPDGECPYSALERYIYNILAEGESLADYGEIEIEDVEN